MCCAASVHWLAKQVECCFLRTVIAYDTLPVCCYCSVARLHCGRRQERNERGGFFAIFQHNKWRARQQRISEAARLAAPVPA